MSRCRLTAEDLDEEVVAQFLNGHLPDCRCPAPVVHTREDLRAALGHLLVVLRANAVIPERVLETTPVDEELRRFDVRVDRVRGLAATTRRLRRRRIALHPSPPAAAHQASTRLLASGSSLKEVAYILRHRPQNTTLIYAKLDTRSLSTVALPWPGNAKWTPQPRCSPSSRRSLRNATGT